MMADKHLGYVSTAGDVVGIDASSTNPAASTPSPEATEVSEVSEVSDPPTGDDVDALRADIETTRDQLADTVSALAAKADLKARAQDEITELRERAQDEVAVLRERARRVTVVAVQRGREGAARVAEMAQRRPEITATAVVAVVGLLLLARRRPADAAPLVDTDRHGRIRR